MTIELIEKNLFVQKTYKFRNFVTLVNSTKEFLNGCPQCLILYFINAKEVGADVALLAQSAT